MFSTTKLRLPSPDEALTGRSEVMPVPEHHFVNGARLQPPYPEGSRVADFAAGCFWGVEKTFWQTPGVIVTAVGYQGGSTPNPTYGEVCTGQTGHAESVRVVYDPTQGMRQGNDVGTQYRSAIYWHDEDQRAAAETSRDAYQRELTAAGYGQIATEIREAPDFYFAEDYHQQYLAKNPQGYCPDHSTGVACPVGLGVKLVDAIDKGERVTTAGT